MRTAGIASTLSREHEFLAILVDLLNGEGRDHQPELAKNDVLGLIADLAFVEMENL